MPETTYTFFDAQGYEWAGIADGTPLYEEVKYERPYFNFQADYDNYSAPFDYTFTVTRLSAVPEPTTWALMITGFGLAGAALRRRREVALTT